MTPSQSSSARPVGAQDRGRWQQLYEGYLDLYTTALTPAQVETVWSWLLDKHREVSGLVAEGSEGVIGLAHYTEFSQPLSASVGGRLDDSSWTRRRKERELSTLCSRRYEAR